MSVAAAINILFGVDTKALDKALNNVERQFAKFTDHIKSFSHIFEGLAGFIEPSLDGIVELAHVSERLDIPTQKLAGLRLAADATNVSFESLTGAMQKMLAAVAKVAGGQGEAATTTGKGPAAAALAQLGIDAAQLIKLHPEQQLAIIADRLQSIGNVADRVNIAKGLFGKGGVPMLNVLQQGSRGLQEWQKAAEAAGLALNNLDVRQVEKANEAWKIMVASLKGIRDQIVVGIAPAIQALAAIIRWFAGIALNFWRDWGKVLLNIIEIMVAYRAVVWTIVAAEKAWTTIKIIQAAIAAGEWAKLAAIFAAITAATVALKKIFDQIKESVANIKIPELGKLGEEEEGALPLLKKGIAPPPAAVQRGSAEAIHIFATSGAKVMEGLSRKQVGHLAAIQKNTANMKPPRAANFGGR